MSKGSVDILMITYNRPEYVRVSLPRLLDSCDESMRVWLWHNGDHQETLDVVRSLARHRSVYNFYHSPENKKLREPTNWLWAHAEGEFLGKVDDDCLVPDGCTEKLRRAHHSVPEFGVIGCWCFMEEDFDPEIANKKIKEFPGGHRLLQNFWVGGSGYLMKRKCVERHGLLKPNQSFTDYCIELARQGWVNGWPYPLILMENMDDPRSPRTRLKTDWDLQHRPPLSVALCEGAKTTIASWEAGRRRVARRVQQASINPRDYSKWRVWVRKVCHRVKSVFHNRA